MSSTNVAFPPVPSHLPSSSVEILHPGGRLVVEVAAGESTRLILPPSRKGVLRFRVLATCLVVETGILAAFAIGSIQFVPSSSAANSGTANVPSPQTYMASPPILGSSLPPTAIPLPPAPRPTPVPGPAAAGSPDPFGLKVR